MTAGLNPFLDDFCFSLTHTDYLRTKSEALNKQFAGSATVYTKDENLPVKISLTLTNVGQFGIKQFSSFSNINEEHKSLGYIKFQWVRVLDNGAFGSNNSEFYDVHDSHYGIEKVSKKANRIYVNYIKSSGEYRGEGKALMQTVMEYSYTKGCEGRVALHAAWNSHGFYYGLGMRSEDPQTDAFIAKKYEDYKAGLGVEEHPILRLYMYQDSIETWKTKINANPILLLNDK